MTKRKMFVASAVCLLFLLIVAPAYANTCNNFTTYSCAKSTPNTVRIGGTLGGLITGNSFTVSMTGNGSASDIVIIAAFTSSITGKLNGMSFTSLASFPVGGALGAISTTLQALGLGTSPTAFGYVDLGQGLSTGGSLLVNISGLPAGTAIYGLALNTVDDKLLITNITPNSGAGMTLTTVPEPTTLALFGTGLLGIGALVRKRYRY